MRDPARRRETPVARQFLLLQALLILVLIAIALGISVLDARSDVRSEASDRAVAVAQSVADSPSAVEALRKDDPAATAVLQPFTEEVRREADVDFVVVMRLDRTRLTHTDPERIGGKFIGDLGDAPQGGVFTQQFTGTLGPSMRAVVPVERDGRVIALVSVGITLDAIGTRLRDDVVSLVAGAGAALLVGLGLSALLARRLRRQTHGLGPAELNRMYEYHRAVLGAVREGLLLLDDESRVQLVNDEARRLLDLDDDVVGRPLHELGIAPGLVAAATGTTAEADDLYVAGDRMLVVSTAPAYWRGREVGAVVTLRDRTELRAVTGELDAVRGLTDALRAQNHEAANRLHTVVSLIEIGRTDEAIDFATRELEVAQGLTDTLTGSVEEPALAALLLAKSAEARERGIDLEIDVPDGARGHLGVEARDLVSVLGNLVDNAFDAVAGRDERRVRVGIDTRADRLLVQVDDSGPGVPAGTEDLVMQRGWSTKVADAPGGRGVGLALVAQVARRHRGRVEVADSGLGGARFRVELERSEG